MIDGIAVHPAGGPIPSGFSFHVYANLNIEPNSPEVRPKRSSMKKYAHGEFAPVMGT